MAGISAAVLPISGIAAFFRRPHLWKQAICPLIVCVISTVVSLIGLFSFGFHPQAEYFMSIGWPEWSARIASFLLVFAEAALVNIILMVVLFGCVQSNIQRTILEEKGIMQTLRAECAERGQDLPQPTCCRDTGHTLLFLLGRTRSLVADFYQRCLIIAIALSSFHLFGNPFVCGTAWQRCSGPNMCQPRPVLDSSFPPPGQKNG